jgi:hypothetical protein
MGLKDNFIPNTKILSAEINNNFNIIENWDIKDEIPAGIINGTNLIYTTANNYVSGSLLVLVDGIRQLKGVTNHYIETGANSFSFNAGYAPLAGQDIVVDYRRDMS